MILHDSIGAYKRKCYKRQYFLSNSDEDDQIDDMHTNFIEEEILFYCF